MSTHQVYKEASPYYQSILETFGRWLTVAQVERILRDHGLSVAEYEEDEGDLHERTDAAELLAWMGY